MTANRGSGTAAKFLAAIYAVLWLAVIVYVIVTRDRYQPALIDLSGWRILIAAAGFESAVLIFLTLLKHYGKNGHTPLSQAAVICAFFSNLCVIIPLPCFFVF